MSFIEINSNYNFGSDSLHIFTLMIFIVWFIFLIYSLKIYGTKKTIRYFIPIFIAGMIGELCAQASGSFYYPGYFLYISALGQTFPVIIGLGWSVNLFLFLHMGKDVVTRIYQKHNFKQLFYISICAGLFGVCLDFLEDPLAHNNNWWIWNQSVQRITILEVPLTNYVGWFAIIGGMTFLTLLIDRSHFSENRKLAINLTAPFIIFILLGPYFLFR
jgi:uncharacterized membrane protein